MRDNVKRSMLSFSLAFTAVVGCLVLILLHSSPLLAQELAQVDEKEVFNLEGLHAHDGQTIHEIRIHGLRRTRERSVRWLLSQHEQDLFQTDIWIKGIHKLYNTQVLYNVRTEISPAAAPNQIDIDLYISDRWTFLPFGTAQGGGGSYNFGVGVWDANVLGSFLQVSLGYSAFDNVSAYDLNFYQEFFRDTEYMWGLDFSSVGTPVDLQDNADESLGSFTWQRVQQQLLIGRRYEPNIRLFSYIEYFQDRMVLNNEAPEVHVYESPQYRVRPNLIIGRSNLTNFLEQGYELTLAPTSANFLGPEKSYSTLVVTYKRVFLDHNTNYAMFFNVGAMTYAPIPYLFRLGGYDTVRGFSTNRAMGRYYVNNNFEYRPYLFRIVTPIIGDVIFQGCLFQDFGMMWNSDDLAQTRRVNSHLLLLSHGFGIHLNFLHFSEAIVRFDVARTTIPEEGWGGAFGVGQLF